VYSDLACPAYCRCCSVSELPTSYNPETLSVVVIGAIVITESSAFRIVNVNKAWEDCVDMPT
jgi:hypothetical protein